MEEETVWAVVEGRWTDEVRGRLSIDERAGTLRFRHHRGDKNLDIPLDEIGRVRRLLASPALEIRFGRGEAARRAAFFFAQPPPKPEPGARRATRSKRQNAQFLMGENTARKPVVKAWRSELQGAVKRAKAKKKE